MAPVQSTKRRASVAQAGAPRKAARPMEDTIPAKCQRVSEALLLCTELPETVRRMLSDCAADCLSEPLDGRHDWQSQMVTMIDGALAALEGSLVERRAAAQSRMQELEDGKLSQQTALAAAEESVAKAKDVLSAAEGSTREAAIAETAAAKALEDAQRASATCDTELVVMTADEDDLRSAMSVDGRYSLWRAEGADGAAVKELGAFLQKHRFEAGLAQAVPLVLLKPMAARSPFENMVLKQFEAAAEARLSELSEHRSKAVAEQSKCAAAAALAEEALAAATCKLEAAHAEESAAQGLAKDAGVALREAKKALRESAPALKEAEAEATEAAAVSEQFQKGPLATFQELRDRAAPAPAPMEEESPPATEHTAEPEAMVPADDVVPTSTPERREMAADMGEQPVAAEPAKIVGDQPAAVNTAVAGA